MKTPNRKERWEVMRWSITVEFDAPVERPQIGFQANGRIYVRTSKPSSFFANRSLRSRIVEAIREHEKRENKELNRDPYRLLSSADYFIPSQR